MSSTSTNGSATSPAGSAITPSSTGSRRKCSLKFCMNQRRPDDRRRRRRRRRARPRSPGSGSPRPESRTSRRTPCSTAAAPRARDRLGGSGEREVGVVREVGGVDAVERGGPGGRVVPVEAGDGRAADAARVDAEGDQPLGDAAAGLAGPADDERPVGMAWVGGGDGWVGFHVDHGATVRRDDPSAERSDPSFCVYDRAWTASSASSTAPGPGTRSSCGRCSIHRGRCASRTRHRSASCSWCGAGSWIRYDDAEPVAVDEGDVAILRGPDHYVVSDAVDTEPSRDDPSRPGLHRPRRQQRRRIDDPRHPHVGHERHRLVGRAHRHVHRRRRGERPAARRPAPPRRAAQQRVALPVRRPAPGRVDATPCRVRRWCSTACWTWPLIEALRTWFARPDDGLAGLVRRPDRPDRRAGAGAAPRGAVPPLDRRLRSRRRWACPGPGSPDASPSWSASRR